MSKGRGSCDDCREGLTCGGDAAMRRNTIGSKPGDSKQ